MARPVLVVKNIANANKRYSKVSKEGGKKAVRAQFGIPYALQDIIAAKPRAKGAILSALHDGDRLDGQKLVRILRKIPKCTVADVVAYVKQARV